MDQNRNSKVRVGSRKSELALVQTKHVISLLKELNPEKEFEIVSMSTLGDKILDISLPKIGEKSLFTKELETALATGGVDFVVHSLKDLPTVLPSGMAIGAVLIREDPRDALVLQKDILHHTLQTLPAGSILGTSSLRRTAQLARKYPHLKVESIRGNLNTRLKKLDDLGKYHAIILAAAGLIRIGWKNRISKFLDTDDIMYAVGQGALAIECRENDETILKLLEPLYDLQTALRVIAERSFLKTLGGGCSAPVAVSSNLQLVKNKLVEVTLRGAVWSLDGKEEIVEEDRITFEVLTDIRCSSCPYNNDGGIAIEDIECCAKCPMNPSLEPATKKKKIEIPDELLANDPHEKCPIPLPIGSEFMGQCPYLDGELTDISNQYGLKNDFMGPSNANECPYLEQQKLLQHLHTKIEKSSEASAGIQENENLFAGLVQHKDITKHNLEKARKLGERIARNLMEKGASDVMTKAQAIVHSQQNEIIKSN
ncbi:porphobilinogen deaminase [Cylas formicarius]|uniref:porphobilinogen deaminase n=1 Tax=Cylas formicarius TaxID=197179 RepID=UPI002958A32F|nr:porphobilinogen deaminase [Cylas formicarius]